MPQAFAIANGLDWETEIRSFWAWLEDACDVLDRKTQPDSLVRELVAGQREQIEAFAAAQADPDAARCALKVAVALVGFHYSSNQKLIAGLQDYGVFEPPRELPTFDTIS